jgi:hypothetical protein
MCLFARSEHLSAFIAHPFDHLRATVTGTLRLVAHEPATMYQQVTFRAMSTLVAPSWHPISIPSRSMATYPNGTQHSFAIW